MKRVYIEWVDSLLYHDGWQSIEHWQEMADAVAKHVYRSCGFLVAESPHGYVITTSLSADDDFASNGVFIPKVAVLRMDDL